MEPVHKVARRGAVDWETWLEVQLLDLLGKCAAKLTADGAQLDAAGIEVAAAARAVVDRWDPSWLFADGTPVQSDARKLPESG
jgi:hypothetical protein